jgi:hypothetical protein
MIFLFDVELSSKSHPLLNAEPSIQGSINKIDDLDSSEKPA